MVARPAPQRPLSRTAGEGWGEGWGEGVSSGTILVLTHALPTIWQAERAAAESGLLPALHRLRRLGLADFGDVMLAMPHADMPALSALLPRMPEESIQRQFNGGAGSKLMHDSVSFVRSTASAYRDITGKRLQGARILDFGCGWGRLLRLMPFFADPERIAGVDPMARAIALCKEHGVLGHVARSEPLPRTLPVGDEQFELIYAYSVFTHLSLRAMDTCLAALRETVADYGLLALTVRPIEYWAAAEKQGDAGAPRLRAQHLQSGFAFRPHDVAAVEGNVPYGDSSFDIAWFEARYAQWELRGIDRGWDDMQTVLLLTPR